jgi:hypothetical protein
MGREVDMLKWLDPALYLVVEKSTNQVWTPEELSEAGAAGQFQQTDQFTPVKEPTAVSSPYPCCLQQVGAGASLFEHAAIAQTRHFLVFVNPDQATSN